MMHINLSGKDVHVHVIAKGAPASVSHGDERILVEERYVAASTSDEAQTALEVMFDAFVEQHPSGQYNMTVRDEGIFKCTVDSNTAPTPAAALAPAKPPHKVPHIQDWYHAHVGFVATPHH